MNRILLDDTTTPATERSYQIPWVYDAHAYNMVNKMPERTVDVRKESWQQEIGNPEEVVSLYILTDLPEEGYNIISRMVNLEALYIYTAKNLEDISFLENLTKLTQVMINKSRVKDLGPIAKVRKIQDELYPNDLLRKLLLVAILKSEVSDLTVFGEKTFYSEFLLYGSKVPEDDPIYRKLTASTRKDEQRRKV